MKRKTIKRKPKAGKKPSSSKKDAPKVQINKKISDFYQDRDLSWLDFNFRVLNEALDPRTPLLERLRFIDIYRSNNDEFFMKRIGPLLTKLKNGDENYNEQYETREFYDLLLNKVNEHWSLLDECYRKDIIPSLEKNGIQLLKYKDLTPSEKRNLNSYFKTNIFPILTPLAVDSGHPFPFLSNMSKSIGVTLRLPRKHEKSFARVKIPNEIDQWVKVRTSNKSKFSFVSVEEIIINNLQLLFPGMVIENTMIFRITRSAATSDDEDEIDDKLEMVEEGLRERKFAPIVRFEYQQTSDLWNISFLIEQIDLPTYATSPIRNITRYTNFSKIIDLPLKHLKYSPFQANQLDIFQESTALDHPIFSHLKMQDVMVHFPYDSFNGTVEQFLKIASTDPQVMAIKMTLYRTDADGKLINILLNAAENKKQVAAIVELTARFDEEKNIQWANTLEDAGVHVSYGLTQLKTHAKLVLVVRKEAEGLKTYIHVSTGNFNSQTSKLYTDIGLFTCNEKLTNEAIEVFNYLTGRSLGGNYQNLLVAPFNMFEKFEKMIQREIDNAKKGKPAHIIAKMNSLHDKGVIKLLYKASQAGVHIQLIVRGFCCLRAGVKGLSENIQVYSLVGRLLEHSRIFYFSAGQDDPLKGEFFIGSADWMSRNLFDRVEVITPIYDDGLKRELWDILDITLRDNRHLWRLKADGTYVQLKERQKTFNAQQYFIDRPS